jgi:hypothetical protein
MREFFKPWRRKFGVATLAVACVFAVGWVRSLTLSDYITVPFGTIGSGLLISDDGCFICTWSTSPGDAIADWQTGQVSDVEHLGPVEYPPEFEDVEFPSDDEPEKPRILDWLTQSFRGMSFQRVGSDEHWLAPYWPFVVTLTLVSGYLILSKPRPAKPTEPAHADGERHA